MEQMEQCEWDNGMIVLSWSSEELENVTYFMQWKKEEIYD